LQITSSLGIFPLTPEKIQTIPVTGILLEYYKYSQVLGMLFLSFIILEG